MITDCHVRSPSVATVAMVFPFIPVSGQRSARRATR